MKKIFLSLLLIAVCGVSVSAQKGEMAVGLNLGYDVDGSAFAVGAKFNYGITDHLRVSPSFNYFLGDISSWEINADVHYLFNVADNFKVYPLVGVTYASMSMSSSEGGVSMSMSMSEIGVNLGAGLGYDLTDRIALGLEAKYRTAFQGSIIPAINLIYKF
ncbi:hypothetical protein SAMD00024442_6_73 [Candidatus Symbiothrix dinenymphae]|nr:hypothetical protein SAMD00024442_6_73 [Candidatus Symbiothrix dinenymphae]